MISSSSPKPVIDLKDHLNRFFLERKLNSDAISVLELDYCIDPKVYDAVLKWRDQHFNGFKEKADLESAEWKQQAEWAQKIIDAANKIKFSDDLSQTNLLSQFKKFLKKYPQPGSEKIISSFEKKGHCNGFSYLVGRAFLLQYQAKQKRKSGSETPYEDWHWLSAAFKQLARWDGKSRISKVDKRKIKKIIKTIDDSQHARSKLSIPRDQWAMRYRMSGVQSVSEFGARVADFSEKGIQKILDKFVLPEQQKRESKLSIEEQESRIFRIDTNGHATLIIKLVDKVTQAVQYIFYDPNNKRGPVNVKDPSSLNLLIKFAHRITEKEHPNLSMLISGIGKDVKSSFDSEGFYSEEMVSLSEKEKENLITSLMLHAVSIDQPLLISYFLEHAEMIVDTQEDMRRHSWLHQAVSCGNPNATQLLLDAADREGNKINVNVRTEHAGRTSLHVAARYGFADVAEVLLKHHANADAKTELQDKKFPLWTALGIAAHCGHDKIIDALLEYKANPEIPMPEGHRALQIAVERGHKQAVAALIRGGADVNAEGADGETALCIAAKQGSASLVKLLLKSGVNILLPANKAALNVAPSQNIRKLLLNEIAYKEKPTLSGHGSLWQESKTQPPKTKNPHAAGSRTGAGKNKV